MQQILSEHQFEFKKNIRISDTCFEKLFRRELEIIDIHYFC